MKTCILALCTLLLLVTTLSAQQVSVNYDHNASFAQYHTYAWGSNNANQIRNSILAQVAQQKTSTMPCHKRDCRRFPSRKIRT